jgi:hypothetical protein
LYYAILPANGQGSMTIEAVLSRTDSMAAVGRQAPASIGRNTVSPITAFLPPQG